MNKALFRAALVAALGLLNAQSVDADDVDASVYEALENINIGSLFFSPEERNRLDALRLGKAVPAHNSAQTPRSNRNPMAAGFILKSNGESKVFREGQFESGQPDQEMTFPGDVRIVRNVSQADAPKSDVTDAKKDE